jgi:serine phosphatase RsbU (regulator of sigma subunit)/anti-sigma regulatory factor (Ser/Thr protein kinase)
MARRVMKIVEGGNTRLMRDDQRGLAEPPIPRIGEGQVFLGTGGDAPEITESEALANIYRLNEPTLAELPLEQLMDEQLTSVREILSVDTVAILLINDIRDRLVARAAKGLEEEVEQGVEIPLGQGFAGRIASERLPIFIADINHADVLNPILREKGIRSMLGVPLIVEGDLLGVLHVGTLSPREFTNEDATLLQLVAARVAPAIERARLIDELEREHQGAVALQRSLLPDRLPELIGAPVAARYFPSKDEVGGDWYDVIELGAGRVGLAIGDIAGHGIRAATLMGQLRTVLRVYALDGHSPGEVLTRVDRYLQSLYGRGMATAAYATFDLAGGQLAFASAGHPPPVICGEGRPSRLVDGPAQPPLGAVTYSMFKEQEMTLDFGDILLLYTDGLIEQRGIVLDAGLERLVKATEGARSPLEVCTQIVTQVVYSQNSEDDIAFVALQRAAVGDEFLLRRPALPSEIARARHSIRSWLAAKGVTNEEAEKFMLACGEAIANAIEHAYSPGPAFFEVEGRADGNQVTLAVRDSGSWRAPRGENRGRGFTIIESVMDVVEVNKTAEGTEVLMTRRFAT